MTAFGIYWNTQVGVPIVKGWMTVKAMSFIVVANFKTQTKTEITNASCATTTRRNEHEYGTTNKNDTLGTDSEHLR